MSNANLQLSVTGLTNYIHRCCLVMLLALLTSGCSNSAEQGNSDSQTGEGGGAKVEVPAELSDNEEVKAYFNTLQKVNDEYATLLKETNKNTENEQDGGSMRSAMENMQDKVSSAKEKTTINMKMAELEMKAISIKMGMTSEDKKAFSKAYGKIMERYKEIDQKMKDKISGPDDGQGNSDGYGKNNDNAKAPETSDQQGNPDDQMGSTINNSVELPAEVTDNAKVKAYLDKLRKVNDEYATLLKKTEEKRKNTKDGESMSSAMENMQDTYSSVKKKTDINVEMSKLRMKAGSMKMEMSAEEKKAFSKSYDKIIDRYKEIEQKMQAKLK